MERYLPPSPRVRSAAQAGRWLLALWAPTEALQERWCLGILHRLVLSSGILYGSDFYPPILIAPDPCSRIPRGLDLCPRILDGPDLSVLLNGPVSCLCS